MRRSSSPRRPQTLLRRRGSARLRKRRSMQPVHPEKPEGEGDADDDEHEGDADGEKSRSVSFLLGPL